MSKWSEHFNVDKTKTPSEQLDDVLNHIRGQLDFLCWSAEYQNAILKELHETTNDGSKQSENSND